MLTVGFYIGILIIIIGFLIPFVPKFSQFMMDFFSIKKQKSEWNSEIFGNLYRRGAEGFQFAPRNEYPNLMWEFFLHYFLVFVIAFFATLIWPVILIFAFFLLYITLKSKK